MAVPVAFCPSICGRCDKVARYSVCSHGTGVFFPSLLVFSFAQVRVFCLLVRRPLLCFFRAVLPSLSMSLRLGAYWVTMWFSYIYTEHIQERRVGNGRIYSPREVRGEEKRMSMMAEERLLPSSLPSPHGLLLDGVPVEGHRRRASGAFSF